MAQQASNRDREVPHLVPDSRSIGHSGGDRTPASKRCRGRPRLRTQACSPTSIDSHMPTARAASRTTSRSGCRRLRLKELLPARSSTNPQRKLLEEGCTLRLKKSKTPKTSRPGSSLQGCATVGGGTGTPSRTTLLTPSPTPAFWHRDNAGLEQNTAAPCHSTEKRTFFLRPRRSKVTTCDSPASNKRQHSMTICHKEASASLSSFRSRSTSTCSKSCNSNPSGQRTSTLQTAVIHSVSQCLTEDTTAKSRKNGEFSTAITSTSSVSLSLAAASSNKSIETPLTKSFSNLCLQEAAVCPVGEDSTTFRARDPRDALSPIRFPVPCHHTSSPSIIRSVPPRPMKFQSLISLPRPVSNFERFLLDEKPSNAFVASNSPHDLQQQKLPEHSEAFLHITPCENSARLNKSFSSIDRSTPLVAHVQAGGENSACLSSSGNHKTDEVQSLQSGSPIPSVPQQSSAQSPESSNNMVTGTSKQISLTEGVTIGAASCRQPTTPFVPSSNTTQIEDFKNVTHREPSKCTSLQVGPSGVIRAENQSSQNATLKPVSPYNSIMQTDHHQDRETRNKASLNAIPQSGRFRCKRNKASHTRRKQNESSQDDKASNKSSHFSTIQSEPFQNQKLNTGSSQGKTKQSGVSVDYKTVSGPSQNDTRQNEPVNNTKHCGSFIDSTRQGEPSNNTTAQGSARNTKTQVEALRNTIAPPGPSKNTQSQVEASANSTTQAGPSNRKMAKAGPSRVNARQERSSKNNETQPGSCNTDIRIRGSCMNITQAELSTNKLTQPVSCNTDIRISRSCMNGTQAELSTNKLTQPGSCNTDIGISGSCMNITQAELSTNNLTQAGSCNREVTKIGSCMKVAQAEPSKNNLTQVEPPRNMVQTTPSNTKTTKDAPFKDSIMQDGPSLKNTLQPPKKSITHSELSQSMTRDRASEDMMQHKPSQDNIKEHRQQNNVTTSEPLRNTKAGPSINIMKDVECSKDSKAQTEPSSDNTPHDKPSRNTVTQSGPSKNSKTREGLSKKARTQARPSTKSMEQTELLEKDTTPSEPFANTAACTGPCTKNVTQPGSSGSSILQPEPTFDNATQTGSSTSTATQARPSTSNATQATPFISNATQGRPSTSNKTQNRPSTRNTTQARPSTRNTTQTRPSTSNTTQARPSTRNTTQARPSTNNVTQARPSTSNKTQVRPSTINKTQDRSSPSNTTQTRPSTNNVTQARPSTTNKTQVRSSPSNTTQARPSTSKTTEVKSSTSNVTQTRPSTSNVTQARPSTNNAAQARPSTSNTTQVRPSTCNTTQTRPSTSNATQVRRTINNVTQARPSMDANKVQIRPSENSNMQTEPSIDTMAQAGPSMVSVTRPNGPYHSHSAQTTSDKNSVLPSGSSKAQTTIAGPSKSIVTTEGPSKNQTTPTRPHTNRLTQNTTSKEQIAPVRPRTNHTTQDKTSEEQITLARQLQNIMTPSQNHGSSKNPGTPTGTPKINVRRVELPKIHTTPARPSFIHSTPNGPSKSLMPQVTSIQNQTSWKNSTANPKILCEPSRRLMTPTRPSSHFLTPVRKPETLALGRSPELTTSSRLSGVLEIPSRPSKVFMTPLRSSVKAMSPVTTSGSASTQVMPLLMPVTPLGHPMNSQPFSQPLLKPVTPVRYPAQSTIQRTTQSEATPTVIGVRMFAKDLKTGISGKFGNICNTTRPADAPVLHHLPPEDKRDHNVEGDFPKNPMQSIFMKPCSSTPATAPSSASPVMEEAIMPRPSFEIISPRLANDTVKLSPVQTSPLAASYMTKIHVDALDFLPGYKERPPSCASTKKSLDNHLDPSSSDAALDDYCKELPVKGNGMARKILSTTPLVHGESRAAQAGGLTLQAKTPLLPEKNRHEVALKEDCTSNVHHQIPKERLSKQQQHSVGKCVSDQDTTLRTGSLLASLQSSPRRDKESAPRQQGHATCQVRQQTEDSSQQSNKASASNDPTVTQGPTVSLRRVRVAVKRTPFADRLDSPLSDAGRHYSSVPCSTNKTKRGDCSWHPEREILKQVLEPVHPRQCSTKKTSCSCEVMKFNSEGKENIPPTKRKAAHVEEEAKVKVSMNTSVAEPQSAGKEENAPVQSRATTPEPQKDMQVMPGASAYNRGIPLSPTVLVVRVNNRVIKKAVRKWEEIKAQQKANERNRARKADGKMKRKRVRADMKTPKLKTDSVPHKKKKPRPALTPTPSRIPAGTAAHNNPAARQSKSHSSPEDEKKELPLDDFGIFTSQRLESPNPLITSSNLQLSVKQKVARTGVVDTLLKKLQLDQIRTDCTPPASKDMQLATPPPPQELQSIEHQTPEVILNFLPRLSQALKTRTMSRSHLKLLTQPRQPLPKTTPVTPAKRRKKNQLEDGHRRANDEGQSVAGGIEGMIVKKESLPKPCHLVPQENAELEDFDLRGNTQWSANLRKAKENKAKGMDMIAEEKVPREAKTSLSLEDEAKSRYDDTHDFKLSGEEQMTRWMRPRKAKESTEKDLKPDQKMPKEERSSSNLWSIAKGQSDSMLHHPKPTSKEKVPKRRRLENGKESSRKGEIQQKQPQRRDHDCSGGKGTELTQKLPQEMNQESCRNGELKQVPQKKDRDCSGKGEELTQNLPQESCRNGKLKQFPQKDRDCSGKGEELTQKLPQESCRNGELKQLPQKKDQDCSGKGEELTQKLPQETNQESSRNGKIQQLPQKEDQDCSGEGELKQKLPQKKSQESMGKGESKQKKDQDCSGEGELKQLPQKRAQNCSGAGKVQQNEPQKSSEKGDFRQKQPQRKNQACSGQLESQQKPPQEGKSHLSVQKITEGSGEGTQDHKTDATEGKRKRGRPQTQAKRKKEETKTQTENRQIKAKHKEEYPMTQTGNKRPKRKATRSEADQPNPKNTLNPKQTHTNTMPMLSDSSPMPPDPTHKQEKPSYTRTGPPHSHTDPPHTHTDPTQSQTNHTHTNTSPVHSHTYTNLPHIHTNPARTRTNLPHSHIDPPHSYTNTPHTQAKSEEVPQIHIHTQANSNSTHANRTHTDTNPAHTDADIPHTQTKPADMPQIQHTQTQASLTHTHPTHMHTDSSHTPTKPTHTSPNNTHIQPNYTSTPQMLPQAHRSPEHPPSNLMQSCRTDPPPSYTHSQPHRAYILQNCTHTQSSLRTHLHTVLTQPQIDASDSQSNAACAYFSSISACINPTHVPTSPSLSQSFYTQPSTPSLTQRKIFKYKHQSYRLHKARLLRGHL